MNNQRLHLLVLSGILLATMIVCSQITIPLPIVPLTMQTFAIGLVASLLPVIDSFTVLCIYLIMGAVGLPVFAGFSGGLAVFTGPTAGYLYSFPIMCIVIGAILKYWGKNYLSLLTANIIGMFVGLIMGSLWMIPNLHLGLKAALMTGTIPFIIPGIIKVLLVVVIAQRLQGVVQKQLAK
ncbi:biotin transporter BioY [Liquorilactobacillus mali]|uniref:Biotin transporter n=1 Tax=Liquorilactobacillus mali KCTC 3596 = DSM 20444 TaxID=1046596 RepID=J1F5F0_9LACO|nr:biotin transporter BioY [Liquorilactobacillus mali]EJF01595.1 Biotin synthase, putative [Liquorilactobacillus mali KCTC 3596 = DSM 20444]KRN05101.1 BioY protein [Liquorilactobacillus mali KCTC 3596 = DSM 20444]MDC7952214.1 biotin transporter BioY [Liquorilactobacillus mali]QFQ74421.1 biotin transporter BioY [Liquorilactobacillus mali]